jgi:hypothetical protein
LTDGGDMHRLHVLQSGNPLPFAPAQEHGGGASICSTRVPIANIYGEELDEAAGGAVPCPANQDRQLMPPTSAPNDRQLTHSPSLAGFGNSTT